MNRTVEMRQNGFFKIFSDAITLYEISAAESSEHIKTTIAKASILSTNYALEAAANSCLSSVDITKKLKDEIDRLSTIDKFDFILQWHNKKSLPRGVIQTQAIKELISQRNALVHPKINSIKLNIKTKSGDVNYSYIHESIDESGTSKSKLSNISLDPDRYTEEDALIAVKVLVRFLNIYVNKWWGIDVEESANFLMPTWTGSIKAKSVMYERKSLETVLRNNDDLKIEFLGLYGILEQFA